MAPTEPSSKKRTARGRAQLGLWRAAFALCAVSVLVLSLLPPSQELPTTGWDKSNHMLGFAVLAVLGHFAWPGRRWPMLLGLLTYGGLIEVLQSFTPDRFAEVGDLVADGVGLLAGEALATLYLRLVTARM